MLICQEMETSVGSHPLHFRLYFEVKPNQNVIIALVCLYFSTYMKNRNSDNISDIVFCLHHLTSAACIM